MKLFCAALLVVVLVAGTSALAVSHVPAEADSGPLARVTGDLWVTSDWKKTTLTVASQDHDLVVFLPYSDSWQLLTDGERPLTARDDRLTVDVLRRARSTDDPAEQLDGFIDELLIGGAEVRFMELVERHDRSVLCFQVRHTDTKPWQWFYWSLLPTKDAWLQVTALDIGAGELEPSSNELIDLLSRTQKLTELLGE